MAGREPSVALRHKKTGATDHTFFANDTGFKARAALTDHGYRLKLEVEIGYASMTPTQIRRAYDDIYAALKEVIHTGADLRRDQETLFDLPDPEHKSMGVNQL
jgi:hypothetical protein